MIKFSLPLKMTVKYKFILVEESKYFSNWKALKLPTKEIIAGEREAILTGIERHNSKNGKKSHDGSKTLAGWITTQMIVWVDGISYRVVEKQQITE